MNKPELNLWWEPRDPSQSRRRRKLSDLSPVWPDFDPIYQSWLESPTIRKETFASRLNEAKGETALGRQYSSL